MTKGRQHTFTRLRYITTKNGAENQKNEKSIKTQSIELGHCKKAARVFKLRKFGAKQFYTKLHRSSITRFLLATHDTITNHTR